jgi:hypothetical protein
MMDEKTLLGTTDANIWAQEFVRIFGGAVIVQDSAANPNFSGIQVDEGTMITWFANALEVGRSQGRKELCPHDSVVQLADDLWVCHDCGTSYALPPPPHDLPDPPRRLLTSWPSRSEDSDD